MASDSDDGHINRRRFLAGLGLCPLLPACEFVEVFETEAGRRAVFELDEPRFAALREVGGNSCAKAGAVEILLVRTSPEQVRAFNRFCPHELQDMAKCDDNPLPAEWDADRERLTCTWHGSVFDVDGAVVSGPAERDLQTFPVEFDPETGRGTVFVQTNGSDAMLRPDGSSTDA